MLQTSHNYWLCPDLPDDNVLFAGDHWLLIKCIIPSYHRFVNRSKKLNDFLGVEYEVRISERGSYQTECTLCNILIQL
jgi:hypothetical protein